MKTSNTKQKGLSNNSLAILLMILSVIFWGLSFISTKIVLVEMPPVSIAFFRQIIALVPLVLGLFISKQACRINIKDLMRLVVSSFFGIVLYFTLENNGLKYTTASSASMIVSSLPVFALLTEAVLYKVKISFRTVLYILLSIVGVYLVISIDGKPDFSSSNFFGNSLVMGAMASWIAYTILSKNLQEKYSSLIITTYQTAASIFLFIPFVLGEIGQWQPISPVALGNLIYLGVFCSAAAYFCFLYAIKKMSATVSSIFLNLIPIVTVMAAFLVLDEKLSPLQFMGMIIVIACVYRLSLKHS